MNLIEESCAQVAWKVIITSRTVTAHGIISATTTNNAATATTTTIAAAVASTTSIPAAVITASSGISLSFAASCLAALIQVL